MTPTSFTGAAVSAVAKVPRLFAWGRTTMRSLTMITGTSVFLGFFLPFQALANIGPQWWGDRAAEPLGLQVVAITRENLTIDLRPLVLADLVAVESIYHLNNAGPTKKLDLLFITGVSGVRDFEVLLNGCRVESKPVSPLEHSSPLPTSWEPPECLPGIESDCTQGRAHLAPIKKIVLAFSVELPSGASILRATYRARATGSDEGYPTVTWQFPYILAPARQWGTFGSLDVTIYLPEAWSAVSTPPLERQDDVLRGRFTNVPVDCLAVAVRAPVGQEIRRIVWRSVLVDALVLIGCGILCWWTGWKLAARRIAQAIGEPPTRWSGWALPFAVVLPFLCSAALWGTLALARQAIWDYLGGQRSPYFHERFFMPICFTCGLTLFVIPAGYFLFSKGFNAYKRTFAVDSKLSAHGRAHC